MSQAFLERVRPDVTVVLRMGQSLVDVIEPNATSFVVNTNGLQTGDTSQERRSGQAAEDQDLVVTLQRPQAQRFPIGRETGNIGQRLSELR